MDGVGWCSATRESNDEEIDPKLVSGLVEPDKSEKPTAKSQTSTAPNQSLEAESNDGPNSNRIPVATDETDHTSVLDFCLFSAISRQKSDTDTSVLDFCPLDDLGSKDDPIMPSSEPPSKGP